MFQDMLAMSNNAGGGNLTASSPIEKTDVVNGLNIPSGCTEGILTLVTNGNAYSTMPNPTPVGCNYELIGRVGTANTIGSITWVWKVVPTANKITFSNISDLQYYGAVSFAYNE